MAKLILAIFATFLIVGFAISNGHHVELSLIVGSIKIRLIFLLSVAIVLGITVPFYLQLLRRAKDKPARAVKHRKLSKNRVPELGPEDGVPYPQFSNAGRRS